LLRHKSTINGQKYLRMSDGFAQARVAGALNEV